MDPIARTALLTVAERARESRRPDRLFEDPQADLFAGEQGMALLEAMPGTGRRPSRCSEPSAKCAAGGLACIFVRILLNPQGPRAAHHLIHAASRHDRPQDAVDKGR